jgi:hypothetical protein
MSCHSGEVGMYDIVPVAGSKESAMELLVFINFWGTHGEYK